jgi:heptaprenyl diphosphate synthase
MTPSTSEPHAPRTPRILTLSASPEDQRVAWLAALAITIHIAESVLPSPLPGVKPGLANLVSVVALLQYGWGTAAWIAVLRVIVGSLLLGTFLSPTFMMSAAGTAAALATMGLASRLPGVAAVGHSVAAAMAHMGGQVMLAYWLFIPHQALLQLLPVLMTAAVIFGFINGIIAATAISRMRS